MNNHPGGDVARCEANLHGAWARYFRPTPEADQYEVLVCHGNVLRWLVARALGLDSLKWSRMDIAALQLGLPLVPVVEEHDSRRRTSAPTPLTERVQMNLFCCASRRPVLLVRS